MESTGAVLVSSGPAVQAAAAGYAWTLVNAGTLQTSDGNNNGVTMDGDGNQIVNQQSGRIAGGKYGLIDYGMYGTVTNQGTIAGGSLSSGNGIVFESAGTVTNTGSGALISAANRGLYLNTGGYVVNGAGATISGGATGIWGRQGGVVLTNAGTIEGASQGVNLITGAYVLNQSSGLITSSGGNAIDFVSNDYLAGNAAATVNNLGTIAGASGSAAVLFNAAYANRLIDNPGAVFYGVVNGGAGSGSTLELAPGSGIGTLNGIGSQFVNFSNVDIDSNASWNLTGPVAGSEAIDFNGGNAVLQIANASVFAGRIGELAPTDAIDLTSLSYASGAYGTVTGGLLTISSGGHTATLAVAGVADNTPVTISHDAGIGTDVKVCFLRDTLIATPSGQVRVQTLAVGDLVMTASGTARPITWIGTGRVLATRGQRNAATPVVIRKGALGDNVPNRDLHVTKGHSLFLDNVLIPVEFLVNHRSIIWDDFAREIEIYHIELETHDVLLANGAPAESYRDDGNRWLFRNSNAAWNQEPQEPCAEILTGGPIVDAIWLRLLERAGSRPGLPLTEDPDLHLLIDGERADGTARGDGTYVFRLPNVPATARIVSRAGIPQELGLARDGRMLGVAISRILMRQGRTLRAIEADAASLCDGFHLFEPHNVHRWTNGDAALPDTLFADLSGPCTLHFTVTCATRYPLLAMRLAA